MFNTWKRTHIPSKQPKKKKQKGQAGNVYVIYSYLFELYVCCSSAFKPLTQTFFVLYHFKHYAFFMLFKSISGLVGFLLGGGTTLFLIGRLVYVEPERFYYCLCLLQNELCTMSLDVSILDELVCEYCVYRGIVDSSLAYTSGKNQIFLLFYSDSFSNTLTISYQPIHHDFSIRHANSFRT